MKILPLTHNVKPYDNKIHHLKSLDNNLKKQYIKYRHIYTNLYAHLVPRIFF